jgi:hypothetical protein
MTALPTSYSNRIVGQDFRGFNGKSAIKLEVADGRVRKKVKLLKTHRWIFWDEFFEVLLSCTFPSRCSVHFAVVPFSRWTESRMKPLQKFSRAGSIA